MTSCQRLGPPVAIALAFHIFATWDGITSSHQLMCCQKGDDVCFLFFPGLSSYTLFSSVTSRSLCVHHAGCKPHSENWRYTQVTANQSISLGMSPWRVSCFQYNFGLTLQAHMLCVTHCYIPMLIRRWLRQVILYLYYNFPPFHSSTQLGSVW